MLLFVSQKQYLFALTVSPVLMLFYPAAFHRGPRLTLLPFLATSCTSFNAPTGALVLETVFYTLMAPVPTFKWNGDEGKRNDDGADRR